jgi:hypothetical protein
MAVFPSADSATEKTVPGPPTVVVPTNGLPCCVQMPFERVKIQAPAPGVGS